MDTVITYGTGNTARSRGCRVCVCVRLWILLTVIQTSGAFADSYTLEPIP